MQEEAVVTINGTKLTDMEAMTLRVAIDTLANVLADGLGLEEDGAVLAERYMSSLTKIQALLDNREARPQ
jgi:hypothetical protein